jgi:hypothetical protein
VQAEDLVTGIALLGTDKLDPEDEARRAEVIGRRGMLLLRRVCRPALKNEIDIVWSGKDMADRSSELVETQMS